MGLEQRRWAVDYCQEVWVGTKACYLGRPSNKVVQKMARLASLTANASVPTELSSEQKAKLAVYLNGIKLAQHNKVLTERIRKGGSRSVKDAQGTTLSQKKKKAEARLNDRKKRLRMKLIAQARKRYFRKANTVAFDAQFSADADADVGAAIHHMRSRSPIISPSEPRSSIGL